MSKDITISITLSEGDVETLEILRDRYGRDDLTGILEHILTEYSNKSAREETYYSMFTYEGDRRVHEIVQRARAEGWDWPQTYEALEVLAQDEKFGEATDTAVREYVYSRCGFTTAFYI